MNAKSGGAKSGGSSSGMSGQKFSQTLVNQGPVYDRKLKVHRPRKKGKGPQWL